MIIEEHVLFGKYRLCRKLGSGASGTVYLAYHMELEEYRAIKVVPKAFAGYETFRKEALFLKTLRNPGIPIVYDVAEDLYNSYLIEEYLEGESLYALVKRLGSLSMEMAVEFGIQICRLIQFMYSAKNPILYLDLQPKNLFVCTGKIRLTDFDHAQYAKDVQTFGERYGTIGFAAPEQYRGEPLDCRTDIYAVGALLYFMCCGRPPGACPDFSQTTDWGETGRIIRGCMAQKKEERYQNAEDLIKALMELQTDISKEHAIHSQIIAFAGTSPGIGTTHAAIGLSNFLTRNGYSALYQETYDTTAVRNLLRRRKQKPDRFGVCRMDGVNLRPFYGKAVHMSDPYFPIIIKDTGTAWKDDRSLVRDADLLVLVCGGKWWELDTTISAVEKLAVRGKILLLFNHGADQVCRILPEELQEFHSFWLPFFPNPFEKNEDADACFRELFLSGTGGAEWKKKRKRKRFLESLLR